MNPDLENRVRKLERANRVLVLLVVALALVFLFGGAAADGGSGPLQAQRIELVDAEGLVRAALGTDAEGSSGLFVYDPAGAVRLSLTHDADQSALFIRDAEGTVRVGVAQFAHGGGGVALHGAGAKGAAVLYHKENGSLSFYDTAGNVTARVPAP